MCNIVTRFFYFIYPSSESDGKLGIYNVVEPNSMKIVFQTYCFSAQ